MPTLSVYNREGKEIESVDLPEKYFGEIINTNVIHQAVLMYQASQRQGTASTKNRSQVSGGGRKPWRQKGTGRARHGSIRSPLWIAGGVVFGPQPRDFSFSLPKKIKKAALRESLNAKFKTKEICCLDLKDKFSKTKEFAKVVEVLKLDGSILALLDGCDENISRACRNIAHLELMRAEDVNAFDILRFKNLLLTKSALKKLLKRIQPE